MLMRTHHTRAPPLPIAQKRMCCALTTRCTLPFAHTELCAETNGCTLEGAQFDAIERGALCFVRSELLRQRATHQREARAPPQKAHLSGDDLCAIYC